MKIIIMKRLEYLPRPKSSFIQWHITERCNLRCKHCYQTSYATSELTIKKLTNIFHQYLELLGMWGIKGRIQITGGEPFLRQDALFKLLELCHDYEKIIPNYGIMSNGFFVTEKIAKELKDLRIKFFQVSLDGMEKSNDLIRGRGSFKKIIGAIKILVKEEIPTSISFTSNKMNWKDYTKLIRLANNLGVDIIWSDRMVPSGSGEKIKNQMLQPSEVKKFYKEIVNISENLVKNKSKTYVGIGRTLYFLLAGNKRDTKCCALGTRGLAIMPNGDVYPCRRMPLKVGDLKEQSLFEVWYSSELLWKLRDKNCYMNSICEKCQFFEVCGGGAPCLTHGYCGTPFAPDPQCWIAFSKLPDATALASTASSSENSNKEPIFWDNIIAPASTSAVDSYFEVYGEKLYYRDGKNKIQLVKAKNDDIKGKNIFLEIDAQDMNFEKLAEKVIQQKPDMIFISFKFESKKFPKKTSIMQFLQKLREAEINFKLTEPLFEQEYFMARKFHLPTTLKESLELFIVNNGFIELPSINRMGPPLIYMKNRNQIYEYFEVLHEQLTKNKNATENKSLKNLSSVRDDKNKIMCYQ